MHGELLAVRQVSGWSVRMTCFCQKTIFDTIAVLIGHPHRSAIQDNVFTIILDIAVTFDAGEAIYLGLILRSEMSVTSDCSICCLMARIG